MRANHMKYIKFLFVGAAGQRSDLRSYGWELSALRQFHLPRCGMQHDVCERVYVCVGCHLISRQLKCFNFIFFDCDSGFRLLSHSHRLIYEHTDVGIGIGSGIGNGIG